MRNFNMKNKINRYSVIIFISLIALFCSKRNQRSSPSGPPFPDLPAGADIFSDGRYFFTPPVAFYRKVQLGEILFKKMNKSPHSRFYMSIAGKDLGGNFRLRSYEGTSHRTGNTLEMRVEKCYVFGKKSIDERLSPMERWDCDHLIFSFEIEGAILKWASSPRTKFSDWTGPFNPTREPGGALFSAQILEILPDGSVIAFGKDASRHLNPNHTMSLFPGVLTFHTVKRYGDFIICTSQRRDSGIKPGAIIYTSIPKKTKGLYDD